MELKFAQCVYCKHYKGKRMDEDENFKPYCSAFPDEIPDEIYNNEFIHDKPYKGDHGIMFEPMNEDCLILFNELIKGGGS